jgi:hypothetical protein
MGEKIIYANVVRFSSSDDIDFEILPEDLQKAKVIWDKNGEQSTSELIDLVQGFVNCQFLAENMPDWKKYFSNENYGEFNAEKINVVAVDFSESILPLISAEAWIKVSVLDGIPDKVLNEWVEEQWGLQSGVMWSWNIPNENDWDSTMEDNAGMEAVWGDEIY